MAMVVDDEEGFRTSLAALVKREGFEVCEADSLKRARECLIESPPDVVLMDLGLPDGDGMELITDDDPARAWEFVVITGKTDVETAVKAMRAGALDYLVKPIDRTRLKAILSNVIRTRELKRQVLALRGELRSLGRFGSMVGSSRAIQQVFDLIQRVAPTDASVLISGESGTGKELVAETIHQMSKRRDGPFLAVNCGAITETVMESELFGHEKGSFTGADRARRGYFEEAHRGTLLLDEISEMPLALQVKLLRVLETGKVLRVGSSEPVDVDVRVIAATNRNPAKAVKDGQLREDLFYRLNVFPIAIPPLRDREADLDLLADHFLHLVNARDSTSKTWSPEALEGLRAHSWPGNVRELRNAVERAAILADDVIPHHALPLGDSEPEMISGNSMQIEVGTSIHEVERRLIVATLSAADGDKRRAAKVLGISLKTLYNRLHLYGAGKAPLVVE